MHTARLDALMDQGITDPVIAEKELTKGISYQRAYPSTFSVSSARQP